ncbi:hypothetical protein Tco_0450073 [Tanacetum coccineum]
MHSMGKMLAELHAMLKLHEKGAKRKAKGKNKLAYAPKTKIPSPPTRDNSAKDSICYHRKEVGYRRRNYPSYHAALKRKGYAYMASTSGSRKLKHGALSMYMGNGMRAAVEAIRSFDLILSSGLIILCERQDNWKCVLTRLIDDLLALDSKVRFDISDRRLELTATFSIPTYSEVLDIVAAFKANGTFVYHSTEILLIVRSHSLLAEILTLKGYLSTASKTEHFRRSFFLNVWTSCIDLASA